MAVIYRDIPGHPGYRVGDDGSVWSCWQQRGGRPAVMGPKWWKVNQTRQHRGHMRVYLRSHRGPVGVHVLVLLAFIGPCPEGMEACHDPDPDPANNRLTNLRWDTRRANAADRVRHGRHVRGDSHPLAKMTPEKVRQLVRAVRGGMAERAAAAAFGVGRSTVRRIMRGEVWAHVTKELLTDATPTAAAL